MSTYLNAYRILSEVRIGVGEHQASFLTAPEQLLKFKNEQLLADINRAQDFIYGMIVRRKPSIFTTDIDLTGVDSVFTLPPDFGSLVLFKDDDGKKVFPIGEDERKLNASTGSKRMYYRRGNTLVLDQAGITAAYNLVYVTKPRRIHAGVASAGASTSITLDRNYAPKVADYFNGMVLENETQDTIETITDYSAVRVATISGTGVKGDIYGIVPDLPEECHQLIAPRTIIAHKASNPLAKSKPSKEEVDQFNELLLTTLRSILGRSDAEVDWVGMFTRFEPALAGGGYVVTE